MKGTNICKTLTVPELEKLLKEVENMIKEYKEVAGRIEELRMQYRDRIAKILNDPEMPESDKRIEIGKVIDDFAKDVRKEAYRLAKELFPYDDDD